MGHLTQMAGLAVQNFVSAAVGMAVAIAVIRGFIRRRPTASGTSGSTSCGVSADPAAIAVVGRGRAGRHRRDPELLLRHRCHHARWAGTRTLPGGPVASQEVIKELGTNGGGFYNANSAHPFENPTALSNWLENFLLLLIPVCLT